MLDKDLREENLFLIACDEEPTKELLTDIREHPACYPALAAWTNYVEATGQRPVPPDPPVVGEDDPAGAVEDPEDLPPAPSETVAEAKPVKGKKKLALGKPKDVSGSAPLPAKNARRTMIVVSVVVGFVLLVLLIGAIVAGTQGSAHGAKPSETPAETNTAEAAPVSEPLTVSGEGFICRAEGRNVTCWGQSHLGQLGAGASSPNHVGEINLDGNVTQMSAGADFACATTGKGVTCWGDNRWRQAADSDAQIMAPTPVQALEGKKVTSLASGELHTCAIAGGKLYCWGSGFSGQLADGQEGAKASGVKEIPLPEGEKPLTVMASRFGSCLTTDKKKVYCWGANDGQRIAEGEAQYLGLTEMKASHASK